MCDFLHKIFHTHTYFYIEYIFTVLISFWIYLVKWKYVDSSLTQYIWPVPKASLILMDILEAFPPKLGTSRIPLWLLLFNHCSGVVANAVRWDKEIKAIKIRRYKSHHFCWWFFKILLIMFIWKICPLLFE